MKKIILGSVALASVLFAYPNNYNLSQVNSMNYGKTVLSTGLTRSSDTLVTANESDKVSNFGLFVGAKHPLVSNSNSELFINWNAGLLFPHSSTSLKTAYNLGLGLGASSAVTQNSFLAGNLFYDWQRSSGVEFNTSDNTVHENTYNNKFTRKHYGLALTYGYNFNQTVSAGFLVTVGKVNYSAGGYKSKTNLYTFGVPVTFKVNSKVAIDLYAGYQRNSFKLSRSYAKSLSNGGLNLNAAVSFAF